MGNQLTALLRQLGGLIEIITVDLQVHCVIATGSAGRNSTLVLVDFRVFRHLLTENLCKSPDVAVTLPFLRQTDGHLDLVVHRGREERSDRGIVAGTGGGADQLDLRNEFHKPCLQLTCGLEGLLDTRTALQFDGHGQTSIILLLHEVRTDLACKDRNQRGYEESNKDQEGERFVAQTPTKRLSVVLINDVEHVYYRTLVPALLACLVVHQVSVLVHVHFLRLEQLGTEHRSQRDSHERRGTAYDGDDPSQFMEHDTRHSVQHRQGHEHCHEHEGRRDDGYPNLVGSVDRRLMRILAALHVTGDILQDDNRVIHHHTDRDGERTEGDDIQTRIRHTEVDKRHDEGNRNRDTDNDGSTPFTEEEEHDEHDEEEGVKHRLFEGVDGVLDILRGVVDLLYLHVRRQLFLYLRQCGTHVAADLHGVRSCLLGDDQKHRLTTVGLLVQ